MLFSKSNYSEGQIDNFMLSEYNLCVLYSSSLLNSNNELMYYIDPMPNIDTAKQCQIATNGVILSKIELISLFELDYYQFPNIGFYSI